MTVAMMGASRETDAHRPRADWVVSGVGVRDLRRDPVVLRELKGSQVLGQAVDRATDRHGDAFSLRVQAFAPPSSDAAAGPTYAEVKAEHTHLAEGTTAREPDDDRAPEPAGRPSAERG